MESVILCRYGELFLKAGNRRAFERILASGFDSRCDQVSHQIGRQFRPIDSIRRSPSAGPHEPGT